MNEVEDLWGPFIALGLSVKLIVCGVGMYHSVKSISDMASRYRVMTKEVETEPVLVRGKVVQHVKSSRPAVIKQKEDRCDELDAMREEVQSLKQGFLNIEKMVRASINSMEATENSTEQILLAVNELSRQVSDLSASTVISDAG